jgi:hypothetical protein
MLGTTGHGSPFAFPWQQDMRQPVLMAAGAGSIKDLLDRAEKAESTRRAHTSAPLIN